MYVNRRNFRVFEEIGLRTRWWLTSDFRPKMEIWPFRAFAMKNMQYNRYYRNSSVTAHNWLWGSHVPQNVFLVHKCNESSNNVWILLAYLLTCILTYLFTYLLTYLYQHVGSRLNLKSWIRYLPIPPLIFTGVSKNVQDMASIFDNSGLWRALVSKRW